MGLSGLNFRVTEVKFRKTGAEIKQAVQGRIRDLEQRLAKRDVVLADLLEDRKRLRSYLVRDRSNDLPVGQFMQDTPSEDHQEITELCRRVSVIETELGNLRMVLAHLRDEQEFDLTFQDMVTYGFGGEVA